MKKIIQLFIPKKIRGYIREVIYKVCFYKRYGFIPPPSFSDMSGYEILLDTILKHKIYELEGDIVEIGAFLGGGTYKLSKFFEKIDKNKKIYVIDIFNVEADHTMCDKGISMSNLYKKILEKFPGQSQYDIFKKITEGCNNIVVIKKDSKQVSLPCEKICFAYIDGNHSTDYVRNDFYLCWNKLVSGGIIAFDDYGYDLPQVTETIDELIGEQSRSILKIWKTGLKTIFIQKR